MGSSLASCVSLPGEGEGVYVRRGGVCVRGGEVCL